MLNILDFVLHIDTHLATLIANYGALVYFIMFLIIFIETGLVVFPFLPGDSLLFAAGTFAALGDLNVICILLFLSLAAIIGDSINYFIGKNLGIKAFKKSKLFSEKNFRKTEKFYDKHGEMTIVLARFIPIIRTFAPFVAGIGKMNYSLFLTYNIIGGICWVSLFTLGGYLFGNISLVKENFSFFIIGIIFLSTIPVIIEIIRQFKKDKSDKKKNKK